MITEAQRNHEELPSLGELLAIAKAAKDNETKARALCLASGVALRMGWPKKAVRLMERAAIVAKCDGVQDETRAIIMQNRVTLLDNLFKQAGFTKTPAAPAKAESDTKSSPQR